MTSAGTVNERTTPSGVTARTATASTFPVILALPITFRSDRAAVRSRWHVTVAVRLGTAAPMIFDTDAMISRIPAQARTRFHDTLAPPASHRTSEAAPKMAGIANHTRWFGSALWSLVSSIFALARRDRIQPRDSSISASSSWTAAAISNCGQPGNEPLLSHARWTSGICSSVPLSGGPMAISASSRTTTSEKRWI